MNTSQLSYICTCWVNTTCLSLTSPCDLLVPVCVSSLCFSGSCLNATTCLPSWEYNSNNTLCLIILFAAFSLLLAVKSVIAVQVRWIKLESPETPDRPLRPLTLTDLDEAHLKTLRTFTRRLHVH